MSTIARILRRIADRIDAPVTVIHTVHIDGRALAAAIQRENAKRMARIARW